MIIEAYNRSNDLMTNPRNYIVYKTNEFKYYHHQQSFEKSITMLGFINKIKQADMFLKSVGAGLNVDLNCLYKGLDSIICNKPLSKEDLKNFYDASIEFEKFTSSLDFFQDVEPFLEFDTELLLWGFGTESYLKLDEDSNESLSEKYYSTSTDYKEGKISFNDLYKRINELLANFNK